MIGVAAGILSVQVWNIHNDDDIKTMEKPSTQNNFLFLIILQIFSLVILSSINDAGTWLPGMAHPSKLQVKNEPEEVTFYCESVDGWVGWQIKNLRLNINQRVCFFISVLISNEQVLSGSTKL